jgi:hypothetical protein
MRTISPQQAMQEATALCMMCLRQKGMADATMIKSEVLRLAELAMDGGSAPKVATLDIGSDGDATMLGVEATDPAGGFRFFFRQEKGDPYRDSGRRQNALAYIAWAVDQLQDNPEILAASPS